MNHLNRQLSLSVWSVGIFKVGFISFGIIVGAMFAEFWMSVIWAVGIVCVVALVWTTSLGIGAMREGAAAKATTTPPT